MTTPDILAMRLSGQGLSGSIHKTPEDTVRQLGAVQAQDYYGALWALGLRLKDVTSDSLEADFNAGKILRTHVLRPTWHFVHPSDAKWMLELTREQVKRLMGSYNKKLDLTERVFDASQSVFRKKLSGSSFLTRQELKKALEDVGISTNVQRLAHIIMQAELDCVVTSGPRRGKQFTYALFDDRISTSKKLTRDVALQDLTKRYFKSHGPATLRDFAWWSGLKMSEVREGVQRNKELHSEQVEGVEYWFFPSSIIPIPHKAFLLPNYDEYGIGYSERSAFFDPAYLSLLDSRGNATFQNLILIKGKFVGTWKRTLKKDTVLIECTFFSEQSGEEREALGQAVEQYGKFLNKPVVLAA